MELTSPTYLAKEKVQTVQDYVLFCGQAVANIFRKPRYFADMALQADTIGVGSLPIVVLTGFFTGAVLALQASNTLERFGSLSLVGQFGSNLMVRGTGPGAYQFDGGWTKFLRHGQRIGIDDGDRTD